MKTFQRRVPGARRGEWRAQMEPVFRLGSSGSGGSGRHASGRRRAKSARRQPRPSPHRRPRRAGGVPVRRADGAHRRPPALLALRPRRVRLDRRLAWRALRRDFLPDDLEPAAATAPASTPASRFRRARRSRRRAGCSSWPTAHPFIAGVVGWVDLQRRTSRRSSRALRAPAQAGRRAPRRAGRAGRPLPAAARLLPRHRRARASFGLAYDILIYPRHLPVAVEFVAALPAAALRARPPRQAGDPARRDRERGRADLRAARRRCRTSGASSRAWSPRRTGSAGRRRTPAVSRRGVRLLRPGAADDRVRLAGLHGGRRLRADDGRGRRIICETRPRAERDAVLGGNADALLAARSIDGEQAMKQTRTTRSLARRAPGPCSLCVRRRSRSCWPAAAAAGGGEAPRRLTIAVIPKGTTHVFWQIIHAGAEKAAQELGVEVIWRGPLREDDRESQITEVEDSISRGVSGIVARAARRDGARRPGRRRAMQQQDPGRHLRLGPEGRRLRQLRRHRQRQGRPAGRRAHGRSC